MSSSFADLGVSKAVAKALASRGFHKPFPVQELVIADVLAGHDVLVQSPTGSGKTLAFGVPMVDRIDESASRPSALVLAPTRELAQQIADEIGPLAHARALGHAVAYGGVGIQPQIKRARNAHVLIATPGRLEDLLERRAIRLDGIQTLVLDEADRMLDMGFKPAVDRIVRQMPAKRQTLFFSATLEGQAGKVASSYTHDARRHVHAPTGKRLDAIEHRFLQLPTPSDKFDALVNELRGPDRGRTLVFVRTKRGADRLVKRLGSKNVKAAAMHGDKSQGQRQRALDNFDRGKVDVLVATDVAARGIDVAEITHVINFDIPEDLDAYTHRVGRTGRAGASGLGISLMLPDQQHEMRRMAADLGLSPQFDSGVGAAKAGSHNGSRSHGGGNPGGGSKRHGGPRSHKGGKSGGYGSGSGGSGGGGKPGGGGAKRYGGGKHRSKSGGR